jgi:hypothetical protein
MNLVLQNPTISEFKKFQPEHYEERLLTATGKAKTFLQKELKNLKNDNILHSLSSDGDYNAFRCIPLLGKKEPEKTEIMLAPTGTESFYQPCNI